MSGAQHQPAGGRGEDGLTLVETLVTIILVTVVGLIVLGGVIVGHRALRHDDDEAQGLADVRKVSERLSRDVRNARGVAAGADARHLQLWIDDNADYRQEPAETVTWDLRASTRPGQYDVVRSVQGAGPTVEATTVINDLAFTYDQPAPDTRLVTATIRYDAQVGRAAGSRTITFADRLRNVR